jgi:hypothetical protein
MACQAASATASLREVLKAGPLCRQRILDLKKISAMALNSTRPEHMTSLILYRGTVVMPRWNPAKLKACRRGSEIRPRRTPPRPRLGTSSRIQYRLGEGALRWSCLQCYGPLVVAAPQQACPKPLGSQEPPALSRRVPLLVMPLVVGQVGTLGAAAHSEVPAHRWVDDQRSCVRCGGYEPSNI